MHKRVYMRMHKITIVIIYIFSDHHKENMFQFLMKGGNFKPMRTKSAVNRKPKRTPSAILRPTSAMHPVVKQNSEESDSGKIT